ncbi:hypothetical protein [Streptomyces sp. NBRC 110028]|uniref:hypothetical protein n=1 Tax=Streptomyces sp. NBRC 110028 TaxID=1621260 RepID=UPI0006E22F73|nr:hypothetical protein [Streptomyces sp. NBRC 110028]
MPPPKAPVGVPGKFAVDSGAWVLVGLVPADADEDLHVLGALLIMGVGSVGLLLAARPGVPSSAERASRPTASAPPR